MSGVREGGQSVPAGGLCSWWNVVYPRRYVSVCAWSRSAPGRRDYVREYVGRSLARCNRIRKWIDVYDQVRPVSASTPSCSPCPRQVRLYRECVSRSFARCNRMPDPGLPSCVSSGKSMLVDNPVHYFSRFWGKSGNSGQRCPLIVSFLSKSDGIRKIAARLVFYLTITAD